MLFYISVWLAVSLYIAYLVLVKPKYDYWKRQGVVGPAPSAFVGNLGNSVRAKKSLGQTYASIYNQYKDLPYVGIYKFYKPVILLHEPELVKDILIKHFGNFHRNTLVADSSTSPVFLNNLFFLSGEKWKVVRSKLSTCFTVGKVKVQLPLLDECGEKMIAYVHKEIQKDPNTVFDGKELSVRFTTENIASCMMGTEGKSFDEPNPELREIIRSMFSTSLLQQIKILIIVLLPFLTKILHIRFVSPKLEKRFTEIVTQLINYRTTNNIERNDFLNVLKEWKTGKYAPDELQAAGHCAGMFIDGIETSARALAFLMYNLAENPCFQEKLKDEIDSTISKFDGLLTYEAIQAMTFLDCLYNESLRLHPPAVSMDKVCNEKYMLKSQFEGRPDVEIEVGTSFVIPIYGLHQDSRYFPNPTRFDPDRFSPENKSKIVKGTYIPFGDGPRACIGQRFAALQLKVGIIHLVKNFKIILNNKTKTPLEVSPLDILLAPKSGLWFNFTRRVNA